MLESLLIKWQACNLIKKKLQYRCFPLSIGKSEVYLEPCQTSMMEVFSETRVQAFAQVKGFFVESSPFKCSTVIK